jgi:hypothetical protein
VSPIQIAAIAVRLFAIWLAIYCARWTPYLYGVLRDSDDDLMAGVLAVAGVLLSIGTVLFLWFFPRTVARSVLPAGDPSPGKPSGPDAWLTIGCTLLGLWVLTDAIPALVRNIYVLFYTNRINMSAPEGWGARTLQIGVELAIAVWLLLGARGLRRVISWARGVGAD